MKKKQATLNRLGFNPTPETLYATFKSKNRWGKSKRFAPEAIEITEYFGSVGSVLAAQIKQQKTRIQHNRVKETMFISPSEAQEVAKVPQHLKNKKDGHDGISKEILNCRPQFS